MKFLKYKNRYKYYKRLPNGARCQTYIRVYNIKQYWQGIVLIITKYGKRKRLPHYLTSHKRFSIKECSKRKHIHNRNFTYYIGNGEFKWHTREWIRFQNLIPKKSYNAVYHNKE